MPRRDGAVISNFATFENSKILEKSNFNRIETSYFKSQFWIRHFEFNLHSVNFAGATSCAIFNPKILSTSMYHQDGSNDSLNTEMHQLFRQ